MLRTSLSLMRPGVGNIFMVSLYRVSLFVQPFVTFLLLVILFFVLLCPFLKNRTFLFGFVFRVFVIYFFFRKLETGFQKNN